MKDSTVYSERLGIIRDEQFQAAMSRLGLGDFVRAEPTTSGLFGQNVFVTTTKGEYVLRGAPHWVKGIDDTEFRRDDRVQFTGETYFANALHERTGVPVPWPFLHEQTDDIFGWPFIVMARMPGYCFDERGIVKAIGEEDRRGIARALAINLVEMQRLTSPFPGAFNPTTVALEPFPNGYVDWATREIGAMIRSAHRVTEEDRSFIAAAAERARAAGDPATYSFLHIDYKLNNLTVMQDGGSWRVTGLFDLHEARYGDGAHDLVRQACSYLDFDPPRAPEYVRGYLERLPDDPARRERLPLYILNDRMKFWQYFTDPAHSLPYFADKTFANWSARYVDAILNLL